ncbi:MAG: hypothetical protein J6O04_10195 [Selenomonadaceae bacterium]|nr:hypothetical protein [Selenomonadaceae bacterium]
MDKILAACFLLMPGVAFAAEEVSKDAPKEAPRLFSPMMADVILVFALLIIILLIAGTVYNFLKLQNMKNHGRRIKAISGDLKAAITEIHSINAYLFPSEEKKEQPKPAAKPPKEENAPKTIKREVWQDFADNFNNLANSMEVPKAGIACENFVKEHKLILLKLVSKNENQPPKFALGEKGAPYWGWQIPGDSVRFAVAVSPELTFDEKFQNEGGLKEMFASNFKDVKEIQKVEIKIPAIVIKKEAEYTIEQPGLLRFS